MLLSVLFAGLGSVWGLDYIQGTFARAFRASLSSLNPYSSSSSSSSDDDDDRELYKSLFPFPLWFRRPFPLTSLVAPIPVQLHPVQARKKGPTMMPSSRVISTDGSKSRKKPTERHSTTIWTPMSGSSEGSRVRPFPGVHDA